MELLLCGAVIIAAERGIDFLPRTTGELVENNSLRSPHR